ncbi:uncharacterized protein LACBIDRAFT_292824 [Laccaria bicolor S238N-H82]|uniref:Pre-rRNA-processing protein RIX1 n=1 Tax=Laccaria bicolor (strain S238N-H82 / ATCC MYA-4686) TaxID=486041 RepID=B0CXW4_LACBS|nr:uncharacterized protein LACBIDRAFT_292824 [Laccaria bicolor S238N-H82]EDR12335.1 predicted protein [Laccaria bicolor S238N-H82]|eukprot:XP_001876599.1 predicted protein [Laccaria bicolor S238N-H82]
MKKNEPPPTLKAAIRLIVTIFSTATDVAEFQRQVSTPNIPKFIAALIATAGTQSEVQLQVCALRTLAHLIPLYPTTSRASYPALSSLALQFLNGSALSPTNITLLESASQLYAVLHQTGGKVGATNLWRKSLDETLAFGWDAFFALRTTFRDGASSSMNRRNADDSLALLNLDRLRSCVVVTGNLLSTTTQRPVQIPLGHLIKFIIKLLTCTTEEKADGYMDPTVHAMEVAATPQIWGLGCKLLSYLTKCAQQRLTPYMTNLITVVTYHLEQNISLPQRTAFLESLNLLLTSCHYLESQIIANRLTRAVLPSITTVLFTTSSREDDVIRDCVRNPSLSPAVHSTVSRLILSIALALPQIPPALLSPDPSLFERVYKQVRSLSVEIGTWSSSAMSRSLPLLLQTGLRVNDSEIQCLFNLLLHPRVPPLIRSMPHIESISLFPSEGSEDEREDYDAFQMEAVHTGVRSMTQDMAMVEELVHEKSPQLPRTAIAQPKSSVAVAPTPPSLPAFLEPDSDMQDVELNHPIPEEQHSIIPALEQNIHPNMLVTSEASGSMAPVLGNLIPDDEDEPMPVIDMNSDSEEDE